MKDNKNDHNKQEILQKLQADLGLSFISDIKNISEKKKLAEYIAMICEEVYDTEEWKDAFLYITGKRCTKRKVDEIKEELIQELKKA